jgi:hypothetical protein
VCPPAPRVRLRPQKTPEIKQSDIINDDNHKEESSTNQFFRSLLG